MIGRVYASILLSGLALLPTTLQAASPSRVELHPGIRLGTPKQWSGTLAARLRSEAPRLGWHASTLAQLELEVRRAKTLSSPNVAVLIVEGRIAGARMLEPVAKVLVDTRSGEVVSWAVSPLPELAQARTSGTLAGPDAIAAVRASGRPGSLGPASAELVAVTGPTATTLAWKVDPPLDRTHLTNPEFLVDAATGDVGIGFDRVRTAKVIAFDHNPVRQPDAEEYDLINIDENATFLDGPYFSSTNCNVMGSGMYCGNAQTAEADGDGNFLFPAPDVTDLEANRDWNDTFAEVQMYYHADKFLASLMAIGFDGLPCHVANEPATLVANFKLITNGEWAPFDNAFYGGDCDMTMVFGQGTDVDFAYDGDVVYHELGHGVVDQLTTEGLGRARRLPEALVVDAGGLNEAIADFVSSSFAGDPLVADYVGEYWQRLEDTGYIRDNANDYRCPEDLAGQVHADGEPFASLTWALYQEYGDASIPIVLDTTLMLQSDALLEEAAQTLAGVTGLALGIEGREFVEAQAEARGLFGCARIREPGEMRRPLYTQPAEGYSPFPPPAMQFKVTVPADMHAMTVSFVATARSTAWGPATGEFESTLLVKSGAPITFTYAGSGQNIQVTSDEDVVYEDLGDDVNQVVLVEPGQDVYFGIVNAGAVEMLVDDVAVAFSPDGGDDETGGTETGGTETGGTDESGGDDETGATDDGGGADDDTSDDGGDDDDDNEQDDEGKDDGCGCTSNSAPSNHLAWLVPMAWAARRRRRG